MLFSCGLDDYIPRQRVIVKRVSCWILTCPTFRKHVFTKNVKLLPHPFRVFVCNMDECICLIIPLVLNLGWYMWAILIDVSILKHSGKS